MGLPVAVAARLRGLKSVSWSGEHVVLASMLLVSGPVTASWSAPIAVLVVPVTLVVAVGFWYASRRRIGLKRLASYCALGGAIAGAIDAGFCYSAVLAFSQGSRLQVALNFPVAGLMGVLIGVGYGLGFLPVLLLQASALGLRRTEAIDRCLIGCGLWGLVISNLGSGLQPRLSHYSFEIQPLLDMTWSAVSSAHGFMLVLGLVPWLGRRFWLQRVASGKVRGWQLCNVDDFGADVVATLPAFCKPLRASAKSARVLAQSRTGDVYRGEVLEPKYLVL